MGAVLAGTATVWSTMSQRDKERDLLFVGNEFRAAIGSYYERTPGGAKQYPKTLEDLLLDKRQTMVVRYLRRIYVDPMTGQKKWGLVKGPNGTIMGIYSLATGSPIKTGNFAERDKEFQGKLSYTEWKFVYQPQQPAAGPLRGVPRPAGLPPGVAFPPGIGQPGALHPGDAGGLSPPGTLPGTPDESPASEPAAEQESN